MFYSGRTLSIQAPVMPLHFSAQNFSKTMVAPRVTKAQQGITEEIMAPEATPDQWKAGIGRCTLQPPILQRDHSEASFTQFFQGPPAAVSLHCP